MGRIVRLQPLAIILVLAVGGIVAGIAGAIVAVPAAAAILHASPYLRRERPAPPGGPPPPGRGRREGGAGWPDNRPRTRKGTSVHHPPLHQEDQTHPPEGDPSRPPLP